MKDDAVASDSPPNGVLKERQSDGGDPKTGTKPVNGRTHVKSDARTGNMSNGVDGAIAVQASAEEEAGHSTKDDASVVTPAPMTGSEPETVGKTPALEVKPKSAATSVPNDLGESVSALSSSTPDSPQLKPDGEIVDLIPNDAPSNVGVCSSDVDDDEVAKPSVIAESKEVDDETSGGAVMPVDENSPEVDVVTESDGAAENPDNSSEKTEIEKSEPGVDEVSVEPLDAKDGTDLDEQVAELEKESADGEAVVDEVVATESRAEGPQSVSDTVNTERALDSAEQDMEMTETPGGTADAERPTLITEKLTSDKESIELTDENASDDALNPQSKTGTAETEDIVTEDKVGVESVDTVESEKVHSVETGVLGTLDTSDKSDLDTVASANDVETTDTDCKVKTVTSNRKLQTVTSDDAVVAENLNNSANDVVNKPLTSDPTTIVENVETDKREDSESLGSCHSTAPEDNSAETKLCEPSSPAAVCPDSPKSGDTKVDTSSEKCSEIVKPADVVMEDDNSSDIDITDENKPPVLDENERSNSLAVDYHTQQIKDILQSSLLGDTSSNEGNSDCCEGQVSTAIKLKRSSRSGSVDTSEVAVKRSKLINGKLRGDSPSAAKKVKATKNGETKEEKPSQKRVSERSSPRIDVKKVRMSSDAAAKDVELVEDDADSTVGDSDENLKTVSKSLLSNLDKAIDRVAAGGVNKRDREICDFLRQLETKSLERITLSDLEELVCHKLGLMVTERSEVGQMRETIKTLTASVDKWRTSCRSMAKQIKDLELVFKKLVADSKAFPQSAVPIKITRSVGLQVGQPHTVPKKALTTRNEASKANQLRPGGIITNRNNNMRPAQTPASLTKPPLVVNRVVGPSIRTPGTVSLPVRPGTLAPTLGTLPPPQTPMAVRASVPPAPPVATRLSLPPQVRTIQVRPSMTAVARQSPPTDYLIDLTDEDDKAKAPGSPVVHQNVRVVNSVGSPRMTNNTIRLVSQNQLLNSNSSTGTFVSGNAPRLTYVLPPNGAGVLQPRNVIITSASPQPSQNGPRNFITVTRPQAMLLTNSAITTARPHGQHVVRATGSGVYQPMNRMRPPVVSPNKPLYRQVVQQSSLVHPAPLPQPVNQISTNPLWKLSPPQPELKISKSDNRQRGIILSWKMDGFSMDHETIATYQLYAYQETNVPASTSMWKKVGDVKSMPLPMACTLTQFSEGNKYHFAVRAIDVRGRSGLFSVPGSILLTRANE